MRGKLKTKLVPLVATTYGFDAAGTPKVIKKNQQLHELLKRENWLAYRVSALSGFNLAAV
jgi:hypothetical protein